MNPRERREAFWTVKCQCGCGVWFKRNGRIRVYATDDCRRRYKAAKMRAFEWSRGVRPLRPVEDILSAESTRLHGALARGEVTVDDVRRRLVFVAERLVRLSQEQR